MLIQSGIIVASLTFLSRIFGMLRELFVAATFGTGTEADAVNVAFKFPNLFRRIFAEGALSSVFVPMFSSKLTESSKSAEGFANKIFWLVTIVLCALVIIMQYFMPYLMYILAPGFVNLSDKFELTVLLCRITIPYLIFISLAALIGGIMNSFNKFAAFAAAPIIMSIIVIIGTKTLSPFIGSSEAIAWAILFSGILQLFFMLYMMKTTSVKIKFHSIKDIFNDQDYDTKILLHKMIPATITNGISQISLFISQSIASFMPGAISILSYADRIYQVPLSVIGITFNTVLLPTLSKLYKNNESESAHKTQNEAINFALLTSIPIAVFIIFFAENIIKVIYEHGAFLPEDTIKTSQAIMCFTLGLPAFILSKIFTPIFYANLDLKTPLNITYKTIILNIIITILLYELSYIGIALSTAISAWYNVYLLYKASAKSHYVKLEIKKLKRNISQITMISIFSVFIGKIVFILLFYYISTAFIFYILNLLLAFLTSLLILVFLLTKYSLLEYSQLQTLYQSIFRKKQTKSSIL
jgi:putative peptidoglycan lipid II flippase